MRAACERLLAELELKFCRVLWPPPLNRDVPFCHFFNVKWFLFQRVPSFHTLQGDYDSAVYRNAGISRQLEALSVLLLLIALCACGRENENH